MPILQIPRLAEEIRLNKEWKVKLQKERRNDKMIQTAGSAFTLAKGHLLRVERIYIRQSGINAHSYDSITFRSLEKPLGRFFVSLDDANGLSYSKGAAVVHERHTLWGPGRTFIEQSKSKAGLLSNIKRWGSHHNIFRPQAPQIPVPHDLPFDQHCTGTNTGPRMSSAYRTRQSQRWAAEFKNNQLIDSWLKDQGITFSKILENLPPGYEYQVETL